MADDTRLGGIQKGTRHNTGISHREATEFVRKAQPGDELRAGKGLYLRKTEGGAFWVLRYVSPVTGKQVRADLWGMDGSERVSFPTATVEAANNKAALIRGEVAAGVDPLVRAQQEKERKAAEDELARLQQAAAVQAAQEAAEALQRRLTMRQLFERWCAVELKPSSQANGKRIGRKDHGAYTRQQFERHVFPELGERHVADVTRADLLALIDKQRAKGQLRTASVLLSDLRQMLSFAVDRELIEHNPLAGLKKSKLVGAPVERDRVLSPEEITALHQALPDARMNKRSEAAIWLMLATGARLGELMGAVWAEDLPVDGPARQQRQQTLTALAEEDGVKLGWVDLGKRQWHLPTTKNERQHTIHLSPFALRLFSELATLRERNPKTQALTPWVFPARDPAKPVCPKSLGKQLADRQRDPSQRLSGRSLATEALRLPGGRWTAHDLRRTAGTLMASLGISGDTIDEALNHVIESRVRRTYIRDRREADQARAFDALGDFLSQLTGKPHSHASNVRPLRAA